MESKHLEEADRAECAYPRFGGQGRQLQKLREIATIMVDGSENREELGA